MLVLLGLHMPVPSCGGLLFIAQGQGEHLAPAPRTLLLTGQEAAVPSDEETLRIDHELKTVLFQFLSNALGRMSPQ
jgi:hypothetical protein